MDATPRKGLVCSHLHSKKEEMYSSYISKRTYLHDLHYLCGKDGQEQSTQKDPNNIINNQKSTG